MGLFFQHPLDFVLSDGVRVIALIMAPSSPSRHPLFPAISLGLVFIALQLTLSLAELEWVVVSTTTTTSAGSSPAPHPGVSLVILLLVGAVFLAKFVVFSARWDEIRKTGSLCVEEWRSALTFAQSGEDLSVGARPIRRSKAKVARTCPP